MSCERRESGARGPRDKAMTSSLVFRKGLDLKAAVAAELNQNYYSDLVQQIKADDFQYRSGRLTVHLAREFGFCYGVDRAVDYAYQTRERFPDRRVFLTGEIIHNPHVNDRLRRKGIQFLNDPPDGREPLGPDDVVVLPAFGVTTAEMQRFAEIGCVMVDTTCGSVLNVWKNVKRYAQDGFTSIIHGKVWHEETQATASQALTFPEGRFLVVLNLDETNEVCDYIRRGGRSRSLSCALQRCGVAGVRSGPRPRAHRPGQPDHDAHVRVARSAGIVSSGRLRPLWRRRAPVAVPGIRHHLQRDAGSSGCGRHAAEGHSGRSDDCHRGL